jgi:hypothetical protein
VIEAARLGPEGQHLSGAAEQLYKLVQRMRKQNQANEGTMARIEVQLEPWATDADLAFQSYEDVFRATGAMDGHIRKTTETLLAQAKMIQGLNQRLAAEAPAVPAPLPPAAVDDFAAALEDPAPEPARVRPSRRSSRKSA